MPVFQATRRVAVPADLAFEVAADVASYREFLPLLQRSSIRGGKQDTGVGESFHAELAVSYPKLGLSGAFTSHVETDRNRRTVRARSTDGPFRSVETLWQIVPAQNGADVSIRIDYAFRNPLIQIAAAAVMETAISKVMTAFEARAKSILAERNALQQV